jgi:hypothetical protein
VHVPLDLEGMSFRPFLPRLAALLLEKAEGDSIRHITHKELAEHLRVYRESATSALASCARRVLSPSIRGKFASWIALAWNAPPANRPHLLECH